MSGAFGFLLQCPYYGHEMELKILETPDAVLRTAIFNLGLDPSGLTIIMHSVFFDVVP